MKHVLFSYDEVFPNKTIPVQTIGSGGALYIDEGQAIFNDCMFIDNYASRYGGTFYINNEGKLILNHCEIINGEEQKQVKTCANVTRLY